MREEALHEAPPRSRRRQVATALVGARRPGAAASRACSAAARPAAGSPRWALGSLLVFVGVALSARYVVRPLAARRRLAAASASGTRPASSRATTRRATRRAPRSPRRRSWSGSRSWSSSPSSPPASRTRSTARSTERAKADLVVTSDTVAPLSRAAGPRIDRLPSVVAAAPQYLDQVQVNGHKRQRASPTRSTASTRSRCATSTASAGCTAPTPSCSALGARRGHRRGAVRQGARHRGRRALPRHRRRPATRATLTAIAEYRDPQLMQGVMVDVAQFRALSSLRDPMAYFVTLVPGTRRRRRPSARCKAALADVPVGQGPHPRASTATTSAPSSTRSSTCSTRCWP